jgi:hypothetical protein
MKHNAFRMMTIVIMAAGTLCATPITGVTLPDPPLMAPGTPGNIVSVDLGNGLIWEGPEVTPEEWNARMQGVPPSAGFAFDQDPAAAQRLVSPDLVTPTPEPSTLVLMGAGLAAGIWWRRRR